jgi:hypothetical protein
MASDGQPGSAPQVDVPVCVEAPGAEQAVEVAGGERGLGDGGVVEAAGALDRLQDDAGRVVRGGRAALGLQAEALDVTLVERAARASRSAGGTPPKVISVPSATAPASSMKACSSSVSGPISVRAGASALMSRHSGPTPFWIDPSAARQTTRTTST